MNRAPRFINFPKRDEGSHLRRNTLISARVIQTRGSIERVNLAQLVRARLTYFASWDGRYGPWVINATRRLIAADEFRN